MFLHSTEQILVCLSLDVSVQVLTPEVHEVGHGMGLR